MAFFNSQSIHAMLESEKNVLSYTIAGAVVGLITSLVISLFQFLFTAPAYVWFPSGEAEGFESLPSLWQFLLPVIGALVLGGIYHLLKLHETKTGLPYTVLVVNKQQSNFPLKNTITQFFGAITALASGFSVGQEGPAVHLGAASACHVAKHYQVPQNHLRIFAGCGVAAAIAAAFNTPLAGVIFAMEVVLLEYTIAGFAPVIMAAISATTFHKLVHGHSIEPVIEVSGKLALYDHGWLFFMAICTAAISALFVITTRYLLRFQRYATWLRFLAVGLLTGSLAIIAPQIMGTGSDTIAAFYDGNLTLWFIGFVLLAKLLATSAAIAVGIPGGLIGPSLFLGAGVGALFSAVASLINPDLGGNLAIYVLLGMAGMMSAAINAPLAAIIFIMELSFLPGLVFPGLIMVLLCNIGHQSVFRLPSIVQLIFDYQGVDLNTTSFQRALSKRNVMQLLNNNITELRARNAFENEDAKDYFIVSEDGAYVVSPIDKSSQDATQQQWFTASAIGTTATAFQAWRQLEETGDDYLVCERKLREEVIIIGVIKRQDLIDYVLH